MEKYRSVYPTLRQAKTKWSKPSIVAKQGEGPSHDWYDMLRKDARAKLAASIQQSKLGSITKQQKIFHEESEQPIYHVTHTKHIAKIQKHGILPMKTSNWVKAKDGERYGGGEVYAFTHKDDAHAWAGRMDWAHHKTLGSGKISIITAHRPKDRKFSVDTNDPLSQSGSKGPWLKTHGSIEPHHIISVEPYKPRKLGEGIGDFIDGKVHGMVQTHLNKVYPTGKLGRNTDDAKKYAAHDKSFLDTYDKKGLVGVALRIRKEKKSMSEDRIGKPTPSADQIAKKHNVSMDAIEAQIAKGISVEREHTNNDQEAAEIARDHIHEFPDYYDRLDKMEKKAKKDMKENYDQDKEILKNRIDTHRNLAQKYAEKNGEASLEAAFHRALVKRMEKELGEGSELGEETYDKVKSRRWRGRLGKIKQELPPKKPHPVPAGFERVKDGSFNVLRKIKEDMAPNSVGGGMSPVVGGEGNIKGVDPILNKPLRRKRFAGKQVFVVDPTTFHNAYLGKRKYEHYEKYLEGCDIADEIRAYGRKYWDEPIIIENEITGAMVYLKYGSK